jgi:hypothetical protein
MAAKRELIPAVRILQSIYSLRGQKVLLDTDLAKLYGVTTGNLNKAVSRNRERFPKDFIFRLTTEEMRNLIFQFGISSWGGRRQLPYAFTEQGVAMLSSRVGKHDEEIAAIIDAIRQLMAPPQRPRREIGFHVREKPARYRTQKNRR